MCSFKQGVPNECVHFSSLNFHFCHNIKTKKFKVPKAKVEFISAERTFAANILLAAKETKRGLWFG